MRPVICRPHDLGCMAPGKLFINPHPRALMTFRIVIDPIDPPNSDLHILCLRPFVLISVKPHDGKFWSMNWVYRHDGKVWSLDIERGMAIDPKAVIDEAFEYFKKYYESCIR